MPWKSVFSVFLACPSQRFQLNYLNLGDVTNSIDSDIRLEALPTVRKIAATRREALASVFSLTSGLFPLFVEPQASKAYDAFKEVRIANSQQRLGIELTEVTIGSPSRIVVAVKSVDPFGLAAQKNIQPGLVLSEYLSSNSLIERIKNGPYPIDLKFMNLAAGGDAFGDMEKPLVTAEDALKLAKQNSNDSTSSHNQNITISSYKMTTVHKSSQERIMSRRGDVLEIQYTAAYYLDPEGKKVIYDSSAQRGTGQPYQFVLGSGDMVPGVDLGLYDMYPGEIRSLDIPYRLGYGERGNRLYRIPGGARLFWDVELVSINTVREGDERTREDMDY